MGACQGVGAIRRVSLAVLEIDQCADSRLRTVWASSQPALAVSGWNPSPDSGQTFFLGTIPEGITSIEGSLSGSGSAYTSPDTISLNETFSAPASAAGPGSMQQHVYTVLQPTPNGVAQYTTMYGSNVGPPPFLGMPPPPSGPSLNHGPQSMYPQPNMQHPHSQVQVQVQVQAQVAQQNQAQGMTGQYVLQPDGSQVFIQYN